MSVLVTGGMGYIGSHTTVELLKAGKEVIIIEDIVDTGRTLAFLKEL